VKWEDGLDIGGLTDVGMRRSNNQDSFRILTAPSVEQWRSRGHLFVVADGMGAHAVGELASKMAVDSIPHAYHKLVSMPCAQALVKAVEDANANIHSRGVANRDFQGMGTTCTVLVLLPEGALIAHVGDSRAYRVRDGRIEQLSFDHSLAWELVRRKQLTFEQARASVPNNVITRSLGPEADVETDVIGPHPIRYGDTFVLCSDGLSGQVTDGDIGLIAQHLPAQDACQYLVDMANLRGGPDNITLIVVRVEDPTSSSGRKDSDASSAAAPTRRDYTKWFPILGVACLSASALVGVLSALGTGSNKLYLACAVAAGVLGLGFVAAGVVWRQLTQRHGDSDATPLEATPCRPPIRCTLDKAALDRLGTRLHELRAIAVERAWNVDWTEFFAHRNAADKQSASGDFAGALRELCQAQHLLSLGQRRFQEQTQALLGG
jgi:serine/threonine protein phosphatase PrpC